MQGIWVYISLFVVYSAEAVFGPQRSQLPDHLSHNDVTHCRIPLKDLISTVESTSARVLQGVCNPRDLNERFTTLEMQMVEQFNVLKTMVLNLEDKLRDQDEKVKGQHRKIHRTLATLRNLRKNGDENVTESTVRKKSSQSGPTEVTGNFVYEYNYDEEREDEAFEDSELMEDPPSPRLAEIDRYNSTIHIENDKRIFTYYWTIKDIPYRTKNWGWRRSLRSESFYIFQYGYRMYMRIYPNQNGRNIYIHVGITKGDFDAALEWPFKLKHRIQVLDHALPGQDLISRIWDPTELCSGWNWRRPDSSVDNYECVGLGFSHDTVQSRYYLHNNSLTVKLTVYLE